MYINNKTMYSLLSATNSPIDLVKFAKKNNLPAIGICDKNSTQGFHSFIMIAKEEGVKAILAVDTFVMFENKIEEVLLICCNLKSLYEINKALSMTEYFEYDFFVETIVVFKNSQIEKIKSKDYIGITRNELALNNQNITSNMLLIDSTYYTNETDYEFFQLVNAIKNNVEINKVKTNTMKNKYLMVNNNDEIYEQKLYENYLNLLPKLDEISISSSFKLPKIKLELNISNDQYLYKLVNGGLHKRLNNKVSNKYKQRLEYEFKTIVSLNFVDYFLIVWDIIKYCKQNKIYVGPGRGSAAGSLLAYCLGITNIDPVANNLLFERFLNPMRKTMPDIDLDFDDTRRDEVINYLFAKYGETHVCKIGTLSTFQAKSSFREVAKAIGIPKAKIDSISKMIDGKISFKQNLLTNSKLGKQFATDGQLQYIVDYIYKLEHFPKNKSIHAAGIIISDEEIYNYTSVQNQVSDVDSKTLELMGLVKFDILAISNLRHLSAIESKIEQIYEQKYDYNQITLNDQNVYSAISKGYTNFIFQLESPGMMATLKKFQPKTFDELATILALYRPGPMKYIETYIKRKNGLEKVDYIDASLEKVLKPTYGIIVYQEQIMEIVRIFAGYDLAKADIFRRAISKKEKETLKDELDSFVTNSVKNGFAKEKAILVGERIEAFANYGFNKSHAYSYAKIAYALMYYKVNFTSVYYAYYLHLLKSDVDLSRFEQEVNNFDISILAPSIENITIDAIPQIKSIQLGLNNIQGLSHEFKSNLVEYVSRDQKMTIFQIIDECIIPYNLSEQEVQNLIMSGLFASYGYNEKTLIEYIKSKDSYQDKDALVFLDINHKIDNLKNYNLIQLEQFEKQSMNLNVKYNSYNTLLKKIKIVYPQIKILSEVDATILQSRFDLLIYVKSIREISTKNGKKMAFIKGVLNKTEVSITVFPNEYNNYYQVISNLKGYALVNVKTIKDGFSLENIKDLGVE